MKLLPGGLPGHWTIVSSAQSDSRGHFERIFCTAQCAQIRPDLSFAQVNHSVTHRRGTIRGIHYQGAPAADAKLIRCLRGRVFDVAVDLRAGSPTLGRWQGVEMAPDAVAGVFLPEGFGHGFQALTDDVELLYFHTAAYAPQYEGGVRYDDPRLAISWPLPVTLLSERDAGFASLTPDFGGLPA